jgi:predicted NAD/FAD-binding protein
VCLHTDASVLPQNPRAGASWNYLLAGPADAPPTVTYDLNRLQGLTTPTRFCVTLNPRTPIDERTVLRRFVYRHPVFTHAALRAQQRWPQVSGIAGVHYCGAYWGHGFHEDGLVSALRVGRVLGVTW